MKTCSLALRDCNETADYQLTLQAPDELFEPLERACCHEHLWWYRKNYVFERDYEMEVEPLTERGARHTKEDA